MRPRTHADRQSPPRQRRKDDNRTDTVVATLWLAFYVLAIGVAITSSPLSHTIELAAW